MSEEAINTTTDIEFRLLKASALITDQPKQAIEFLEQILAETVDPRMRIFLRPAIFFLQRNRVSVAAHWIDRALGYAWARRIARNCAGVRTGDRR
jgi:hypothetical protein